MSSLPVSRRGLSVADKDKLDGIAPGATANSPDATLLARANHTGTQSVLTITDNPIQMPGRLSASSTLAEPTSDITGSTSIHYVLTGRNAQAIALLIAFCIIVIIIAN